VYGTSTGISQGLKCDYCSNWYHSNFQDISDEIYEFLQEHSDEPTLQWCSKRCMGSQRKSSEASLTMQGFNDGLSEFAHSVNKKVEELAQIVLTIQNKFDAYETQEKGEVQKRVETKMNAILDTVNKHNRIENHIVHDCVETVVAAKMTKDQEEADEIRKRRTSIIVPGLTEPSGINSEERKANDESNLLNMLHEINCDDVSIEEVIRLGRKDDDPTAKPRPIKLVISSEEQKDKIIRLAKNLKRKGDKGLDKIFIHQDLTPSQRETRSQLVKEMKARKAAGEKNLIINKGKIVERRVNRTMGEQA
jgi:hypothetical protein